MDNGIFRGWVYKRAYPSVLGALLFCAVCGRLWAQDGPKPNPPVVENEEQAFWQISAEEAKVVTVASSRPESVLNSVSNVTVIDRDMIERYNFSSVAEAMEIVPGMMIWRTYALKHLPTIRGGLQEHYANKVLVMIDNVPIWHATTGEGDLDRVGIDAVERIEILRGPASVLYGSNALTGAINIVLRKPKETNKTLGSAGGGVGTSHGGFEGNSKLSRAHGLYAWSGDDYSYMFSADYSNEAWPLYTFLDEARTTVFTRDYFSARSLNVTGHYKGSRFLVNFADGDQNLFGNSLTLATGERHNREKDVALTHYAYDFGPEWWRLKYSVTYDRQRRTTTRDANDNLRSEIVGSRVVNTLSARLDLPHGWDLEIGGDHDYRTNYRYVNFSRNTNATTDENSMRGRLNWEGSAYLQLGYDHEPWKFLLGSRYTHNQISGSNVSSRASLLRALNEHNTLKLMAGQSFRAPTFFEMYFLATPVTVAGNPGLKPERNNTFEAAYLTAFGKFFGSVTGYYTEYQNTIGRYLGTFTRDGVVYPLINFYDNAPKYNSKGVESELRYGGPRSNAFLAFNYLQGSRGDAHPIAAPGVFGLQGSDAWNFKYVPRYTISSGFSQTIGDFFVSSKVSSYASNRSLRTDIGASHWMDASVGYRKGAMRHALSVRNATNQNVLIPEYARQRVVETMPLYNGRRVEYTFSHLF